MSDTIAAISSPPGPAQRGILRLSGALTPRILEQSVAESAWCPGSRRGAFPGRFLDGAGSQPLLLFWMPGPHSYTREDVAELHLPGSPALLQAALAHLIELGARAAGPGEFTRRAFQNGRIDLTRAEGVLELVRASNDAESRSALRLLGGGLGERVSGLRAGLDGLRALCEASLDFDEADTGHVPEEELFERMQAIAETLEEAMAWESARQAPSALPRVLLHGAPNAGKSSLYNALSPEGEEVALVSELAGSTRDFLSRRWSLQPASPLDVLLIDTPGLESAAGSADQSAQRLADVERQAADLLLWVIDGSTAMPELLERELEAMPAELPVLALWNQIDRPGVPSRPAAPCQEIIERRASAVWSLSARTGAGLEQLIGAVARSLGQDPGTQQVGASRELFARHRQALGEATRLLEAARQELRQGLELDLVAETLRAATAALDQIEGLTTPEDLLDRIFARFCIGK